MNTLVKVGLITAIAGAGFYAYTETRKKVAQWASAITFKVSGFQAPGILDNKLIVPLTIQVSNGTPLSVNIDRIVIKLSTYRNGSYYEFGQIINTGFALQPGISLQTFYPVIDVKKLGMFTVGNITASLLSILQSQDPLIDVKIDTTISIEGYSLPTQSETKQLYLKQILANVA